MTPGIRAIVSPYTTTPRRNIQMITLSAATGAGLGTVLASLLGLIGSLIVL